MGFYSEQIVPRFTNVMLGNKTFGRLREEVCAGLHGDVIELGFGSGLNLPHLPPEVDGIWPVEPSKVAVKLAQKRIQESPAEVQLGELDGERLDFPDDRFDAALSMMTLCTIPDVGGALLETKRVLKPGASLHFAEHGLAPDEATARRQHRFDPWQGRFAAGCHLDRDIRALIVAAGFEIETLDTRYIKGPKAWSYMYIGRARKPAA